MGNPTWENLVDLVREIYGMVANIVAFSALVIPVFIFVGAVILMALLVLGGIITIGFFL